MASAKPSCCLKCHFEWEEENAFADLPPEVADQLKREHADLRSQGYPRAKVIEHAEREMLAFHWFCDPETVAFIERDHDLYSQGQMKDT